MNFKKIIAAGASAVMLMSGFAGCASSESQSDNTAETTAAAGEVEAVSDAATKTTGETRVITDHTGAEVTLPAEIDRVVIASLMPLPSVYCLFRGSADDLVGMHPSSMAAAENSYLINVFPELGDVDTSFVVNGEMNIEQLLALDPDVVFYSATNTEEREKYDAAGIPAVGFSTAVAGFDVVETYAKWIELLGDIYGDSEKADTIIEAGRETAAEIKAVTDTIPAEDKPDVLILYHYSDGVIKTSGTGFYGHYWIESAGGRNVAEELKSTPEINMEQIYEWDPDIIFITNFSPYLPEDFYNNTIEGHDWSAVSAVKNGQVHKFPLGMYRWFPPSSDAPLSLMWLAKKIQPELFADIDMDAEIKSYFEKYYNVTLTDDDIQEIYNPAREASGK